MKLMDDRIKESVGGFTLMELIVVIGILMILTTIGLGNFNYSLLKGRDAQRKADLAQVARAIEAYSNDNRGNYPLSDDDIPWGLQWKKNNSIYMVKTPNDPQSGNKYFYERTTDGSGYALYSMLENKQDSLYDGSGWEGTDCGDSLCRYKLTPGGAEKR